MVKFQDALPEFVKRARLLKDAHGEAILRNDGFVRRACERCIKAEINGEEFDASDWRAIEHFMVTIKEAA